MNKILLITGLSIIAILGIIVVDASLNPPTSWSRGTKTYLNYTDMMNETGLRNGSISNITWIGFTPEKISGILQLCPISATNNATLCYNQTSNNLTISYSGSVFRRLLDNRTTESPLPNESLSLSAVNLSANNTFTGINNTFTGIFCMDDTRTVVAIGITCASVESTNRFAIGDNIHILQKQGYHYAWADSADYVGMQQGFNWNGTAVLLALQSGQDFYVGSSGAGNDVFAGAFNQYSSEEFKSEVKPIILTDKKINNFIQYKQKNVLNAPIQYGISAEEIFKTNPELVKTQYSNELGRSVTGIDINGLLVLNIAKMNQTIDYQQQQIAFLKAKVQKLEDRDIVNMKQINYLYNHFNLTKP